MAAIDVARRAAGAPERTARRDERHRAEAIACAVCPTILARSSAPPRSAAWSDGTRAGVGSQRAHVARAIRSRRLVCRSRVARSRHEHSRTDSRRIARPQRHQRSRRGDDAVLYRVLIAGASAKHFRNASITRSWSVSVRLDDDGRHSPRAKCRSETAPPITVAPCSSG